MNEGMDGWMSEALLTHFQFSIFQLTAPFSPRNVALIHLFKVKAYKMLRM